MISIYELLDYLLLYNIDFFSKINIKIMKTVFGN